MRRVTGVFLWVFRRKSVDGKATEVVRLLVVLTWPAAF